MTVNHVDFYNWQKPTKADYLKFRKESPNLVAINDGLCKMFGGTNIGIYNKRDIRGGGAPSSHSFGAALDWRYPTRKAGLAAIRFMIDNSLEFGIQAIHDYVGSTIWRSVREGGKAGWQKQPADSNGMGQSWAKWLHIETTKSEWANSRRIDNR